MLSDRINNTKEVLKNRRKGYPPKVNIFIAKNKNEIIRHIAVVRTPINNDIKKILDKFGGKAPYDKLI